MPGNLQTENIVSDPSPTIVVSLITPLNFLSLSLSLSVASDGEPVTEVGQGTRAHANSPNCPSASDQSLCSVGVPCRIIVSQFVLAREI
jgi:hypothetical protein